MAEEEKQENLNEQIAKLQQERVEKATREIEAILEKYGVTLQAVAVVPASRITIVPRGG